MLPSLPRPGALPSAEDASKYVFKREKREKKVGLSAQPDCVFYVLGERAEIFVPMTA